MLCTAVLCCGRVQYDLACHAVFVSSLKTQRVYDIFHLDMGNLVAA